MRELLMDRGWFRPVLSRLLVAWAGIGCALGAGSSAFAQNAPVVATPPDSMVVSPYGVDMRTGLYPDASTDLVIGDPANGGIEYKRETKTDAPLPALRRVSNWDIKIRVRVPPPPGNSAESYYSLESTGASKSYTSYDGGGTFVENGVRTEGISKLERIGGYLKFTATDGSVIDFNAVSSGTALANKITHPNGIVYTLSYGGGLRVVSNVGYALIVENGGLKACVLNLTTTSLPGSNVCPAGARSVTYTSASALSYSKTDPGGGVTSVATSSYTTTYTRPGYSQPWLTTSQTQPDGFANLAVSTQAFTGGPSVTYAYQDLAFYESEPPSTSDPKYGRGMGWTVNSSATTSLTWQVDDSFQYYPAPPPRVAPGPNTITDPLGRVTTNHWMGGATPYTVIDTKSSPEGIVETYSYGTGGNVTGVTTAPKPGSGLSAISVSYAHDCTYIVTCTKPQSATDARGNTTYYTWDNTHGGMLTETQPAGDSGVNPKKTITWAQYGAPGGGSVWLIQSISQCATQASCVGTADETRTTFTYGANLLPASQTVQSGNGALVRTLSWTYDAEGNKLSEDGPLSGSADTKYWRYDAMRRVTGEILPDPDGIGSGNPMPATRTTYDLAGRVAKVESGTLTSVPDASIAPASWNGFTVYKRIETDYDIQSRKTVDRVIGSDNGIASLTQYSYDAFGRLECTAVRMNPAAFGSLPASACTLGTQGTQGPDRITRTIYDLAGQVVQVRKGVGTGVEIADATFTWTADGKRATVTDANGNKAQMVYDGFDRQVAWIFPSKTSTGALASCNLGSVTEVSGVAGPNGAYVGGDDCEKYAYDKNGNRGWLAKRDGSKLAYTYDALNRITVKVVPERSGLSATHTRDVYYGYDLRGLPLMVRFDGWQGWGVTNDYDALGQLTRSIQSSDNAGPWFWSYYDAHGNRTSTKDWSDHVVSYTYDGLDRLKAVVDGTNTTLLDRYYDARGLMYADNAGGVAYRSWGYDDAIHLTSHSLNPAGTSADITRYFGYNKAGQLTTQSGDNDAYAWTGHVNVDRGYTVNGLNQYTAAGGAGFTYDANGNLTSDGSSTYLYDVENRLVKATVNGVTTDLYYDPLGRLEKVVNPNTGTRRYQYDGDALVAEYDANWAVLRRHVHGSDAQADDPLVTYEGSAISSSTRRFLYSDERGSIVATLDSAGNALAINTYDEYGIPGAANTGRFQYTGQAWLPELGMYYYKARMYSPTLGRFMQTDPIGYEDQFNLYAYVANDPVNGVDSTGLKVVAQGRYSNRALSYLRKSRNFNKAYSRLESSRETYKIRQGDTHSYDQDSRTVTFNPTEGLELKDGSRQSPALGLAHEVGHASDHEVYGDEKFSEMSIRPTEGYVAEDGTIVVEVGIASGEASATAFETRVAGDLGEPHRTDYHDTNGSVTAGSVTEHTCGANRRVCE